MQWHLKSFEQLTVEELYAIIRLRIDIFVVEQNCPYADLDGKDTQTGALHLFATENNEVTCYLRVLAPDISYPDMTSLGRVVTNAKFRGQGLGHQLLLKAVNVLDERWPDKTCHISAQAHLTGYYQKQNFKVVGEGYLEDDIPHLGMERSIEQA